MQRPKSARVGPIGEQPDTLTPSDAATSYSTPTFEQTGTEFSVGTVVSSRYEIVRLIGHGGMGAVYEALDRELDRKIAIKVIRKELAQDPEILRRFKQELLLARQISHRNVVRIHDLGEYEGTRYITMDLVQGRELGCILEQDGPLPPPRAANIALQIGKALRAAHGERVVHRDLKPQNIVVDEKDRVYVMDFGIARSMEQFGMTQTGAVLGTLQYMAPEQAKGEGVDERTDLYSFGLIFYEILTGVSAFKGDTPLASLYRRTREKPTPPKQINDSIPAPLSAIVTKCLEADPARRYQSATEIVQDLDVWLGHGPRTDFRHSRILIPQGRSRWPLALSAALVVILIALGIGYMFRWRTLPVKSHPPVSVLVADFTNHTGDPVFDATLEPMFNVALEGATFVSAFNRGEARKALQAVRPDSKRLDEEGARLVALNQNIGSIITGSISRRGDGYKVSVEALDGASGNSIATSEISASSKDEVLLAIPKLVAPIRKALGDNTPESVQLAATAGGFSAASLEAVHQYGIAMEQQFAGNLEDALKSFAKAAELDPGFARAYAGMAGAYRNLSRPDEAEKYFKTAMEHVDRMTERERLRTRGAYYVTIGNYPKCIEEFSGLVSKYPSDNIGHNNLAACYTRMRDRHKAMEEGKRAVEVAPKAALLRMNLSLFATYAGDFDAGEREAREALKLNPGYDQIYQTLADAQIGKGDVTAAAETYQTLAKLSDNGASLAASGLADLAIYEGRYKDAQRILQSAADQDLAQKRTEQAADKFTQLAYAQLSAGNKNAAIKSAQRALKTSDTVKIRFLAANVLTQAGEIHSANQVATLLAAESLVDPKVYAKLLEGEIALQSNNAQKAIEMFSEANKDLDTWLGHFGLARAYTAAGLFTEADSELDSCIRRKGEVVEVMDDGPTMGYFPAVYYYQGRVRQGLKSSGYSESYAKYAGIRGAAGEDPLAAAMPPGTSR